MGVPDGIKCDIDGNVYSGCGDGINVWSRGGVLLGTTVVEGGVANFCFGRRRAFHPKRKQIVACTARRTCQRRASQNLMESERYCMTCRDAPVS